MTALWVGAAAVAAGTVGRLVNSRRGDVTAARAAVDLPAPSSAAEPLPAGTDLKIKDLSPFTTPNKDFYRVDTALVVPRVDPDSWSLKVHGMVEKEIELDFAQLLARDLVERDITLTCVSNEVGGKYAGNARWLGAPLADLLEEAGVDPRADMILSTSTDGMTIGTPTAVVMDGRDALLAVGMNGEPLPAEHGFPVRMVVPGLYGYVSATKWLTDLELTRFDKATPYWTERGWAKKAPIRTMSRIDTPRPFGKLQPGQGRRRRRRVGAAPRRRQGRGTRRRRRLAEGPAGRRAVDRHLAAVGVGVGRHPRQPHPRGPRHRPRRRHPAREAPNPFPSGATGWHSTAVTVA